jgi:hypothetical protein
MKITESFQTEATIQPKFELDFSSWAFIHPYLLHITLCINKSILSLCTVAFPIGPNWVDPPPQPFLFLRMGASPVTEVCLNFYVDRIQRLISNTMYHCQDSVELCYLYWPIALMLQLASWLVRQWFPQSLWRYKEICKFQCPQHKFKNIQMQHTGIK